MSDPIPLRYRAFLSYSSTDRVIARRLFKQLEKFRLPRGVYLGTLEDPLVQQRKLGRFFLDEAEVGAAGQVRQVLHDNLDASQSLIVICSQAATKSVHVADEIAYFKEHHPDRTILTYVIDGDPAKGSGEGGCFPVPLIPSGVDPGSFPLAADIRTGETREQRNRAGVKIVSGLTGHPFDNL